MKIKSIKISNVLSFSFLTNFAEASPTATFYSDVNILIGANGSGKSNLLEIIYKLFQEHFFQPYYIEQQSLINTGDRRAIQVNSQFVENLRSSLAKNFHFETSPSQISIVLSPDAGDLNNLTFLIDNWPAIRNIIHKHVQQNELLKDIRLPQKSDLTINDICINLRLDLRGLGTKTVYTLSETTFTDYEKFFYKYLRYYNLFQNIIEVATHLKLHDWQPLKNSLALISSMRTYSGFPNTFNVGMGLQDQKKSQQEQESYQSTKNYTDTNIFFNQTNTKLGILYRQLRSQKGDDFASEWLNNNPNSPIFRLNKILSSVISIKLKAENYSLNNDTVSLNIYYNDKIRYFEQLSVGQRSILYLTFIFIGFDIKDGVLILDEPELHLHVAMQRKYLDTLTKICEDQGIQLIMATHSSVFINEKNIQRTFRLTNHQDATKIITSASITQPEKELIKILTYTNSSRIFFADLVLLVEGDTDEYFFKYYYNNYFLQKFTSDIDLQIIFINGKSNYGKWKNFLGQYSIPCCYIGDFDNVRDFNILSKLNINWQTLSESAREERIRELHKKKLKNSSRDGIALLKSLDKIVRQNFIIDEPEKQTILELWTYLVEKQGLKSSQVVEYLKNSEETFLLSSLSTEIDKLYVDGIYILKQGDLETYLGISKDLDKVISFCERDFVKWVDKRSDKQIEIQAIFDHILKVYSSSFKS